jgi:predicted site-specific integrase-resolvase
MSPDMIIGMALGMVASPLMMKGIKIIRHRRKLNKLFREIAQVRQDKMVVEEKDRVSNIGQGRNIL